MTSENQDIQTSLNDETSMTAGEFEAFLHTLKNLKEELVKLKIEPSAYLLGVMMKNLLIDQKKGNFGTVICYIENEKLSLSEHNDLAAILCLDCAHMRRVVSNYRSFISGYDYREGEMQRRPLPSRVAYDDDRSDRRGDYHRGRESRRYDRDNRYDRSRYSDDYLRDTYPRGMSGDRE